MTICCVGILAELEVAARDDCCDAAKIFIIRRKIVILLRFSDCRERS